MINTPADARAFVAATKYPPVGERSWGPHRATMLAGLADQKVYLKEGNDLTFTLAMIETRAALDNVDGHRGDARHRRLVPRAVRSVDRAVAGATLDPMSPDVDRELERIAQAARTAGKIWAPMPHRRAGGDARQARRPLPRGRQRPRLPARRRRRRTQDAQGVRLRHRPHPLIIPGGRACEANHCHIRSSRGRGNPRLCRIARTFSEGQRLVPRVRGDERVEGLVSFGGSFHTFYASSSAARRSRTPARSCSICAAGTAMMR